MTDNELLTYAADTAVDEAWFLGRHGTPAASWIAETCEAWTRLKARAARIEREMHRRGLVLA
ncbi:hypothetical protein EDD28_2422 [Salana multivorans]|uniref:Uncharacterized protein n=2 Tax=Salana multivorans TaxID=120377 RepID=A0A3N2DDG0_9MICO|nr:hypothetical protein EDD28_2422 [Salana multivorans]